MTPGGWRGPAAGVGWAVVGLVIFLAPYAQVPIWPFAYSAVALLAWGALRWGRAMSDRMALPRTAPEWAATVGLGLGLGALGGALITSWLFSRLANALDGGPERPGRGGRFVGLMWVYMFAAGLLSIPAAVATNRGEIVTAAAAAGGLAGLVHVALAPRLRF